MEGDGDLEVVDALPRALVAAVVEATDEAEDDWTATCHEIAHMTLFPKADSWIFGANIPGKKKTVMFYMGGLANYRAALAAARAANYQGLRFGKAAKPVAA